MATIAELRKSIKTTAALLTGNLPSRGTSNMKKAELELYLAEYIERLDKARSVNAAYEQEAAAEGLRYDEETETWVEVDNRPDFVREIAAEDESVNEPVDGRDVATRWLALDPSQQTETPEQMADRLAMVPSPQRDYQTSQEALAVLNEAGVAEEQDFALGDVPELEYDADAELLSFMRTVVEAPSLPPTFPITETDVAVAEVYVVVQLRGKLYDGKLISVVNRRTTLSPAFLVTVELEDGIRRLVRADDTLAA